MRGAVRTLRPPSTARVQRVCVAAVAARYVLRCASLSHRACARTGRPTPRGRHSRAHIIRRTIYKLKSMYSAGWIATTAYAVRSSQ
jgi:hypothetical protein